MPNLPSGTVTFVFSDIEGSTSLLKRLGNDRYAELLATHRRIVRETFALHHGEEIDTQGDAFFYSFPRARDAVNACVEVQRAHEQEAWADGVTVRIRMGLHTGEPAVGDEGYTGLDVVRASRIAAVARGGQVLLSETTRAIVAGDLPDGVGLRPLGDQRLRDIDRPEPLHELRIDGVTAATHTRLPADPDLESPPDPEMHGPMDLDDPDLAGPLGDRDRDPDLRWLGGSMSRIGQRTGELIERRVLAELANAFERKGLRDGPSAAPARPTQKPPPVPKRSVADEISRLQALRDSGALTEEQYARAVDRAIEGEG
jgi:class 3 adenylate cyclase